MVTITLTLVRKYKKMSIRKLAKISGVSRSEISRIESEDVMPRLDTLCELAEALGVLPEDLYIYQKTMK